MRYRTCKLNFLEKTEGESKVPMRLLNNFSNIFLKKNINFCEITQLDFQSNLKKKLPQKFN